MKIDLVCMKCLFGNVDQQHKLAEFSNDGRYILECPQGHISTIVVQESKYEILFEIATNAIIDGYYREAVATFAACIERFYEYAIYILLEEGKVERALVKKTWKLINVQSERQLGAFIFLWINHFKDSPEILNDTQIKFRNSGVHKGLIPTKDKAIEFGNTALNIILPKLLKLQNKVTTSFNKNFSYEMQEHANDLRNDDGFLVHTTIPTIFRLALSEPDLSYSVESHIHSIIQSRNKNS